MPVTRLRVALACATVALLALPAAASAKPGYKVRPAGTELVIPLGEKGDYRFALEANDRQRVVLSVEHSLFDATEYSTRGRVSSKRIQADFGELGRVDVRVRLIPGRSERQPLSERCKGRPTVSVPGAYRGTIEYSGEGGVPAASFRRGKVSLTRRFKRVCKLQQPSSAQGGKKKREPKLEVGLLEAFGEVDGVTSFLGALNYAPKRKPARSFGFLIAGSYERSEGVLTERSTLSFFGHESFRVSKRGEQPETVRVKKLLEPFAGRALYSRKPGFPPSWTGNLRIDLPGAKAIPLAGPEFDATLCRGSSAAEAESCAYGSGSHSQPLALARLSSLR
jgi:hypothetical protein